MSVFAGGCECSPKMKEKDIKDMTCCDPKGPVVNSCCDGESDDCCKEEEEPAKQVWWKRYLERITKSTGGVPPSCC